MPISNQSNSCILGTNLENIRVFLRDYKRSIGEYKATCYNIDSKATTELKKDPGFHNFVAGGWVFRIFL